jgi:hypothetical protein
MRLDEIAKQIDEIFGFGSDKKAEPNKPISQDDYRALMKISKNDNADTKKEKVYHDWEEYEKNKNQKPMPTKIKEDDKNDNDEYVKNPLFNYKGGKSKLKNFIKRSYIANPESVNDIQATVAHMADIETTIKDMDQELARVEDRLNDGQTIMQQQTDEIKTLKQQLGLNKRNPVQPKLPTMARSTPSGIKPAPITAPMRPLPQQSPEQAPQQQPQESLDEETADKFNVIVDGRVIGTYHVKDQAYMKQQELKRKNPHANIVVAPVFNEAKQRPVSPNQMSFGFDEPDNKPAAQPKYSGTSIFDMESDDIDSIPTKPTFNKQGKRIRSGNNFNKPVMDYMYGKTNVPPPKPIPMYFFKVGQGGRSFTDNDLIAMGLRKSAKGNWYFKPTAEMTPQQVNDIVRELEIKTNIKAKKWIPEQENNVIGHVAKDLANPDSGKGALRRAIRDKERQEQYINRQKARPDEESDEGEWVDDINESPADVEQLNKQLDVAHQVLQQAKQITKEIKYNNVADIIVRVQTLAEQVGIDQKTFEYQARDVMAAENALQSAVFSLEEVFEDLIYDLRNKLEDLQDVSEANDPKFIGFMNKSLSNKVDSPKPDKLADAPSWYKDAPIRNFDPNSSWGRGALWGLRTLAKVEPDVRTALAEAGEDAIVEYLRKVAEATGAYKKFKFAEEDIWECQDYLEEIFHDPNITSWLDIIKSDQIKKENLDANQKRAGQVGAEEIPKNISPVLGSKPKKETFTGRLVGSGG